MKAKELIPLLEENPDCELAVSVWTAKGEKTYHLRVPHGEKKFISEDGIEYLRICWVDDCSADRVSK